MLKKPVNFIARKLLYTWVRTAVLPDPPPGAANGPAIDPALPLCYVTDARAWSNLLVLQHECDRLALPAPAGRLPGALRRWHSVYSVEPAPPFLFWRDPGPRRSTLLRGLLAALDEDPALDVQLLPVSIFWGRTPAREKSWIKVLFADTWSIAGRTRKLFTILLHGRHTLVHFDTPSSLRALAGAGSTDSRLDRVQVLLVQRLDDQRTATLGPDMSHRRTLVRTLLRSAALQPAIAAERAAHKLTAEAATRRARNYFYEIAAASTGVTIQLVFRALNYFWNRFYDGISVANLAQVQALASDHALVYVPCHRSHVDYLLLSYVIYVNGLALPSVAAGRNLNLPLIGSVLRGGGAFFIRRSFRGNALYSSVLFEYLSELLTRGAPVEYFVEGTRSRTGRLLAARAGMLSMTVRSYLRAPHKPVLFVPVYVGYEKLLEGGSYLDEMRGRPKQRETLFGALRSMFNLRGDFGKVHLNFGEPLALDSLLDEQAPGWRAQPYDDNVRPGWLNGVVEALGQTIVTRINRAAAVNPVNLVALALLSMPRQTMGERQLRAQLDLSLALLRDTPYSTHVTLPDGDGSAIIAQAERLRVLRRRPHPLGDLLYLRERDAMRLAYYRNNVLHLFALPSMVACCFVSVRRLHQDKLQDLIALAYPFVRAELHLHWPDDRLGAAIEDTLAQFVRLGLLQRDQNQRLRRARAGTLQAQQLSLLARAIQPFLERYYMIVSVLRWQGQALERSELEERCYLLAQRVSLLYELEMPDFYDRSLFNNFVDRLIAAGYARIGADNRLSLDPDLPGVDEDARLMLSNQVRNSILEVVQTDTANGSSEALTG